MGSPDVLGNNNFQSLPERPPTPPREATQLNLEAEVKQLLSSRSLNARLSLHTPPSLYSPTSVQTDSSTRKGGKRVGFSSTADYWDAPAYDERHGKAPQPTPPSLPPSTSRPAKSILKVTTCSAPLPTAPNSTDLSGFSSAASLAEMLESTIQQLSGSDRGSKLDAYMMLARALKASNNLPDRVALQEKMAFFMQFLQRDLVARTETGQPDASMVNHAMTLLITFLQYPAIASTLSNEFAVFVLDHCVRAFEDKATPKDVTRHLMQVVARQNFPTKVMTSDRVGKLVKALTVIEVQGKSIVMARIMIYDKLLRQVRQSMIAHTDWLADVFTDLLSGVKEIRDAALRFGLEAATTAGAEGRLSRQTQEVLRKTNGEQTYEDFYIKSLRRLTKEESCTSVPKVWSVVVLLLRQKFKGSAHFSHWLQLLQRCFNHKDDATRLEAYRAWNHLTYVAQLDGNAFTSTFRHTLPMPMVGPLKAKGPAHLSDDVLTGIIGATCNLYYYAFMPTMKTADLDLWWKEGIVSIMPILVGQTEGRLRSCTEQGIAILTALFDCSTPRVWRETRALENGAIQPVELPSIDPKWLRRNAKQVFSLITPILQSGILELASKTSVVHKLWRTLVVSIASAAAKEVKVSADTAVFMAEALTLLSDLWTRRLPDLVATQPDCFPPFLRGIEEYLEVMRTFLGLLPFTEKVLARRSDKTYMALTTVSRSQLADTLQTSAVHSAFSILSTLPEGGADDEAFAGFFSRTFTPFFPMKSAKSGAQAAQDLLATLPGDALVPFGPWTMVSEIVCEKLGSEISSQTSTASTNGLPPGQEYREVIKLLERGLKSTPGLPWPRWQHLYRTLANTAKRDVGSAGVVVGVAEPMAKTILAWLPAASEGQLPEKTILCATEILVSVSLPKEQRGFQTARQRLWGSSTASLRYDELEHVHALANRILVSTYERLPDDDTASQTSTFLAALLQLLERLQDSTMSMKTILALHPGLADWLRDPRKLINRHGQTSLGTSVDALFDRICLKLRHPTVLQDDALTDLEPLLCAGFESTRRSIVNRLCTAWNGVFEGVESLRYPEQLRQALLALAPHVDLVLPGLEISTPASCQQGGRYTEPESQEDLQEQIVPASQPMRKNQHKSSAPPRLWSSSPAVAASANGGRPSTGGITKPRTGRTNTRNTPIRLRHEDSQVAFATIESSPSHLDTVESQLLTDRQKEVRDRQKDNASVFPEMRSSPVSKGAGKGSEGAGPEVPTATPELPRNLTPALEEAQFDKFVTSTPTPRRGQPMPSPNHDNEGGDPPSSPPEPRRTPLFADIQSQTSANSLLDDWPLSSSPISSPHARRPAVPLSDEPEASQVVDVEMHEIEPVSADSEMPTSTTRLTAEPAASGKSGLGKSAQPSARTRKTSTQHQTSTEEMPSTPSQDNAASRDTPESDDEEFVDAMTSPTPKTPRQELGLGKPANKAKPEPGTATNGSVRSAARKSSQASDIDESDMLRLIVELEPSSSQSREEFQAVSVSPEQAQAQTAQTAQMAQDCIVVKTGRRKRRGRPKGSKPTSPTPPQATRENGLSQSQASQTTGRKRKRDTLAVAEEEDAVSAPAAAARKLRRSPSTTAGVDDGAVSDSQHSVAQQQASERSTRSSRRAAVSSPHARLSHSRASPSKESSARLLGEDKAAPEPAQHSAEPPSGNGLDRPQHPAEEQRPAVERQPSANRVDARIEAPAGSPMQQELLVPGEGKPEPTGGVVDEILKGLGFSLGRLRTAKLSRADVSSIEDVFMEMKRALYEAERRGRA